MNRNWESLFDFRHFAFPCTSQKLMPKSWEHEKKYLREKRGVGLINTMQLEYIRHTCDKNHKRKI